jgi:hypothetical protein
VSILVRRVGLAMLGLVVVAVLLTTPMACTTTVRPPAHVEDPVEVVLLDHGRHSALALPGPDGGMIRYAYGDWHWYALGKADAWSALRALLWPSRSALGYRRLDPAATPSTIEQHVGVIVVARWSLTVERSEVEALRDQLEHVIASARDEAIVNERFDLTFVPHHDAYCYFHNSNHVTAGWLRDLGCEVTGLAFSSSWKITNSDS